MSGKGDTYRKQTKEERERFDREFDRIFGSIKEKKFDDTVSNGELLDELKVNDDREDK